MGLPKHVKRFVYAEIRALEFYQREIDFQKKRIEEQEQQLDGLLFPQRIEGDKVQSLGKPKDQAQLQNLYLREDMEYRRERIRILQRKIEIINDAMDVLDPVHDSIIRRLAVPERDRIGNVQVAQNHHICRTTLYRMEIEALNKLAPLILGVFGE